MIALVLIKRGCWKLGALLALVMILVACGGPAKPRISGEMQVWHGVSIQFDGPSTSENATPNPFRDYRLEVTFTHPESGVAYLVPGFYAADGNAAETSASAGRVWEVRFAPDRSGRWNYKASFRKGKDIAMSEEREAGSPVAFDGASGSFQIAPSDKGGRDFRAKGRLEYVNGHYLRHAGNGEYFLKGGADSPENFLAYYEFDGTFDTSPQVNEGNNKGGKFIHHYAPHARDYQEGSAPLWQGGKGKNIIGALEYLSGKGMDSVYFLTYNIDGGDGKDVWMWTSPEVRDRYDCSKLDQWEIVFTQMTRLGLMMHVVTQETENDRKLGGSPGLNPVRRLYYRELIARFSHQPAVIWNLGEENNTPDPDRDAISTYIRNLDPYNHPITVHTHNNRAREDYKNVLHMKNFEATSIQGKMQNYNSDAIYFREASEKAGRPWVVFGDEQPSAQNGVLPDEEDPNHDIPRKYALWGNLMGGGAGVEWYFGYAHPNNDLNAEDWRSRDRMWDQTRLALAFFHDNLPFWEMHPDNALARGGKEIRVFAKDGDTYAVYLTNGGTTSLKIPKGSYSVRWYNPRDGGGLTESGVTMIEGPGWKSLGYPPGDRAADWVVLVKKQ